MHIYLLIYLTHELLWFYGKITANGRGYEA